MNVMVRRNGRLQRNRNPSAVRAHSDAGSGRRASWNGVRIASSETNENEYEAASPRNGSERPRLKSAPPAGGPASETAANRAVCALTAAGS